MAELVWNGKYDKKGRKSSPLRVALPFQTVETVNESAQERQRSLDLFSSGGASEWRNRLIWGDKKYVLPSLLPEFGGKVDLVYIDPPFATGADFSYTAAVPDDPETAGEQGASFTKEPSVIEQKAYRDTWAGGIDSYLQWFSEAALLLRDLLCDSGSLWVHVDWRIGYQVKCSLDEAFGAENFRNDVIWSYGGSGRGAKAISGQFPRNHDILLWYTKSEAHTYRPQYAERRVLLSEASRVGYRLDGEGRWFKTSPRGDYTDVSLAALEDAGRIHRTSTGNVRIKYFLRQEGQQVIEDVLLGDTWDDIPDAMHLPDREKTGYATQKPESLLRRVIEASSNEGSLVLDCFAGSGTTAVVAEKLNRRWIAADLGRFAINTARKRLLSVPKVRPFVVQNLGKYERQVWQGTEFGGEAKARETAYRNFILELYKAQPIEGYLWLHGVKAGRMVHAGSVDAPVSSDDVDEIVMEFSKAVGSGEGAPSSNRVDVLGWDFAFELNEVAKQRAAQSNVDVHFVRIPREVLDKRAVEQGDVSFFELAALSVDVSMRRREAQLRLTDFVIPLDDVPEEVQRAVTHWSQWIDYWAVDFDNKSDAFHNEWQTYRTRKEPQLEMSVCHAYPEPGAYRIVVKVVDILGNDTTKTIDLGVD